jgi:hypothetical protein
LTTVLEEAEYSSADWRETSSGQDLGLFWGKTHVEAPLAAIENEIERVVRRRVFSKAQKAKLYRYLYP